MVMTMMARLMMFLAMVVVVRRMIRLMMADW